MTTFTPRARRRDAQSSIDAARAVESNGTVAAQVALVLAAVRAHPGLSSLALAEAAGLDRYVVARRLPELGKAKLVERGPLERCTVSDRPAICWLPVLDTPAEAGNVVTPSNPEAP